MSLIDPVDAVDAPNTILEDPTVPTFAALGLPQTLVTALERRGIRTPFAIHLHLRPTRPQNTPPRVRPCPRTASAGVADTRPSSG